MQHSRIAFAAGLLVTMLTAGDSAADLASQIGLHHSDAYAVAIRADGTIVAGGSSYPRDDSMYYEETDLLVTRTLADGAPDVSFGDLGVVVMDLDSDVESVEHLAIDAAGRVVAAALSGSSSILLRFLEDGTLDADFGAGGIATVPFAAVETTSVVIQSDGKLVAAGSRSTGAGSRMAAVRFLDDGTVDPSFGTGGLAELPSEVGFVSARKAALQPDGKILLAGYSYEGFVVGRLLASGTPDAGFHGDGVAFLTGAGLLTDVLSQSDGRIVVVGQIDLANPYTGNRVRLARFLPDGTLDTAFGNSGFVTVSTPWNSYLSPRAFRLALQSGDRIVVAGDCENDIFIMRFSASGQLDSTFDADGISQPYFGGRTNYSGSAACSVAVQSDGRIVAAGSADHGTHSGLAMARVDSTGGQDASFDHDGVTIESDCRRFPQPSWTCRASASGALRITEGPPSSLIWKWGRGEVLSQEELGGPGTTTRFSLCIYDFAGGEPNLAGWLDLYGDAGAWTDYAPDGWSYRDQTGYGLRDGIRSLRLKAASPHGSSGARLRAHGFHYVPLPIPVADLRWFEQDPALVVQLVSSDGLCLSSEFSPLNTKVDDGRRYKSKFP